MKMTPFIKDLLGAIRKTNEMTTVERMVDAGLPCCHKCLRCGVSFDDNEREASMHHDGRILLSSVVHRRDLGLPEDLFGFCNTCYFKWHYAMKSWLGGAEFPERLLYDKQTIPNA